MHPQGHLGIEGSERANGRPSARSCGRRVNMAETHYEKFVDHIMSDDDSELGRVKAERDYALFSLEREIAICARVQECNDTLVNCLRWLDRKGGLGLDVHEKIRQVLSLVGGVK